LTGTLTALYFFYQDMLRPIDEACMAGKGSLYIGTSGWHYEHWKGPFYEPDLADDRLLEDYARQFGSVEINNSFYRLPPSKTFEEWRESVPEGFVFAVKASRFITHMKKLKEPRQPLAQLMENAGYLGTKLGPVLFQLPPRWRLNLERLRSFLGTLPKGQRFAFEFRDHSWIDEHVLSALSERGAAFCIFDLDGWLSPREVTADFVYIRLHGPDGPYRGQYSTRTLAGWAGAISTWSSQGKDVYCYFDNDESGYAPQDALRLRDMVGDGG
jgi:uncharacterized protein YecE (DUF72 family)